MSLICKIWCGSSAHIRNEARLRWRKKELVNVDNHADSVTSIHLAGNVEKH